MDWNPQSKDIQWLGKFKKKNQLYASCNRLTLAFKDTLAEK